MDTTKIKPCHIFLSISITVCFVLAAMLGMTRHKQELRQAEADHMLAQRVAVLEVEKFIRARVPGMQDAERRGYAELIADAANEHRVPHLRVARVAIAESSLNRHARGDGGKSIGIMQVSTKWWIKAVPFIDDESDLRNPTKNIRAGAWILKHYAELCGDEEEAVLACYNGGSSGPNEQAKAYAKRVAGDKGT